MDGVAAANNYLALRNLGYDNVVLYDASWDEWSRDPRAGQQVSQVTYGGVSWREQDNLPEMAAVLSVMRSLHEMLVHLPAGLGAGPGLEPLVWIGFYPRPSPTGLPVTGVLRLGEGSFRLPLMAGARWLLATAVPAALVPAALVTVVEDGITAAFSQHVRGRALPLGPHPGPRRRCTRAFGESGPCRPSMSATRSSNLIRRPPGPTVWSA